jgi:hypothetical protein
LLLLHVLQEDKEHEHDSTIGSVGIMREGLCDMDKLQQWLQGLLRDKGADLFRSKGVLAVEGSNDKWVVSPFFINYHYFKGILVIIACAYFHQLGESSSGTMQSSMQKAAVGRRQLVKEAGCQPWRCLHLQVHTLGEKFKLKLKLREQ